MASNIQPNNIDGTYPIAGVDNDSQGFRTNFTNIQNNFTYAATEISDLQGKVIVKSALSGSTINNNLGGSPLSSAIVSDFREIVNNLTTSSGSITLDHSVSHYYTITTSGTVSVNFSNLPTVGLGRIKLKISVTNVSHLLQLPGSVSYGIDSIEGYSSGYITFAAIGTYIFEFTSDDGGASIHVSDLTRPRMPTASSSDWSSTYSNFSRYSYANVSNNFSVSATNTLYIDSSSISNMRGNVYLPSAAADGQIIIIGTNNAVSTFRVSSNSGALILGNITSLSANSNVKYQYVSSVSKWFKL